MLCWVVEVYCVVGLVVEVECLCFVCVGDVKFLVGSLGVVDGVVVGVEIDVFGCGCEDEDGGDVDVLDCFFLIDFGLDECECCYD